MSNNLSISLSAMRAMGPHILPGPVQAATPRKVTCAGSRPGSPARKRLQNLWVMGGAKGQKNDKTAATVTVTLPSGESLQGQLVRIDDFVVTLKLSDGAFRTFTRKGDSPKVVIQDPLKAHKDLLPKYYG